MKNFCEEVLLLAIGNNYSGEGITEIKAYPPHREKAVNQEKQYYDSLKIETGVYRIKNKGFRLFFSNFRSKFYGCLVTLFVEHPELKKEPLLKGKTLVVNTDAFGFANILQGDQLNRGKLGKTYSFNLFENSWSISSYRLISDDSNEIKEGIKNYNQFWYNKTTSVLKPGSIYRDRWGDLYLSLADGVWSDMYAYQYEGLSGGYSLCYGWGKSSDQRTNTTVLLYLGQDQSILPKLKDIAKSEHELDNFFKTIIQNSLFGKFLELEEVSDEKMFWQSDHIRLKKHSGGKFVKLGQIEGYEELYKKLGWNRIRQMIVTLSYNIVGLERKGSGMCIESIHNFFQVSEDKIEAKLSLIEKTIYREFVLNRIYEWWSSTSDKTTFGHTSSGLLEGFYDPAVEITKDQMDYFFLKRLRFSRTSWTCDRLVQLGAFDSVDDLLKDINNLRK